MLAKRAYFYACVLNVSGGHKSLCDKEFIYAIAGKSREEGALCTVERYDMAMDRWEFVRSMPGAYYAHSGCVLNGVMYVTGEYI